MVRFIKTCHNMRQVCLLLTRGSFWQFLRLGSLKASGVNLAKLTTLSLLSYSLDKVHKYEREKGGLYTFVYF